MAESTSYQFGKYRVEIELGRGGFGAVFRAVDIDLERAIALKILDPLLMQDATWVMNFRREARVMARLEHPHIVPIHEIGEEAGRLYIAMKLIDGGNLAAYIKQKGALPWEETVRILQEIAAALDFAHERQVAHRDLKPANILLGSDGKAVLTDFGFARLITDNSMSVSISGGIVGTPAYIAPEVWEGKTVDKQADIYALGCILYEMATGQALFQGDSAPAIMLAHFKPLTLPESWPPGVPAGVHDILQTALNQEPAARYASAGEMIGDLRRLSADKLAEPYRQLEAAIAAQQWEPALALALSISDENADYRDVQALKQKTIVGQEQAQRAVWASQWRQQAEEALADGNVKGAQAAALRWQEVAPGDKQVGEFLAKLEQADRAAAPPALPPQAAAPAAVQATTPDRQIASEKSVQQTAASALPKPAPEPTPKGWLRWGAAFGALALVGLIVIVGIGLIMANRSDSQAAATPIPVGVAGTTVTPTQTPTATQIAGPTQTPAPRTIKTIRMEGLVDKAVFSPDGETILAFSESITTIEGEAVMLSEVVLLNTGDDQSLSIVHVDTWVRSAVFSPDGQMILTVLDNGSIEVSRWPESGALFFYKNSQHYRLRGHEDTVASAVFSPDGQTIVTASYDGTARLWNWEGIEQAILRGDEPLDLAVFSPDGQRIVTAGWNGTLRLWDRAGTELAVLRGHTSVNSVVFSPDGQTILTAGDETARLWDRSGNQLAVLGGHSDVVRSAVFSPDGQTIVTASLDGTARLWNRSGNELAVLRGHGRSVNSVTFSPDGQIILTAGDDGTARLWDRAGNEIDILRGHRDSVSSAVFSSDGRMVLTASGDGTARLWHIWHINP
ncbi:MAG: serine/threonine-protein kinase [Chloroflexota bacterium]